MMKIVLYFSFIIIFSCSHLSIQEEELPRIALKDSDYVDHLAGLGKDFLRNQEVKEIRIGKDLSEYLSAIYFRIVNNNEALLSKNQKPEFHILETKISFIFSLPKSQFYISNGLIAKYLKNEEIFIAALTAEILKSNRNIYEKKMIVPTGSYSFEKLISLTRLKAETKQSLNEWTYIILKRAGHDSSAYLNWIQIQNRNVLDFSAMNGDLINLSKEEQAFKNFMSKQGIAGVEKKIYEGNSSKMFYKLLNVIASVK